jgi:hypothetical protein
VGALNRFRSHMCLVTEIHQLLSKLKFNDLNISSREIKFYDLSRADIELQFFLSLS